MRIREALTFVYATGKGCVGSRRRAKDMKNALLNATIVAGFNFFTSMAGIVTYQGLVSGAVDVKAATLVSLIYAGVGFFARLMVEMGIKEK